jgi:hypothetical protein
MPREKRLSSRLDTLLDAVFETHEDPFSLYWDIAAELESGNNVPAQKKIRRTLETQNEIGTPAALLVACVLHLTGFPAHRILHFLSLYIPSTITIAQFELAITTIFIGQPPVPQAYLYDLTQYPYLEKRLLLRKGMEISARLKETLSPEVLLYLYLLSLRDDLSNEHVQLISLVMKSCFPALEVRTRLGGASLEEYGDLARAWKAANRGSLSAETLRGTRTPEPPPRVFDRDSASHFLDKYFSDEALSQTRTRAMKPMQKPARPAPVKAAARQDFPRGAPDAPPAKGRDPDGPPGDTAAAAPAAAPVFGRGAAEQTRPAAVRRTSAGGSAAAAPASRAAAADHRAAPARRPRAAPSDAAEAASKASAPRPRERSGKRAANGAPRLLFRLLPLCLALLAVVVLPILEVRALAPAGGAAAAEPAQAAAPAAAPTATGVPQAAAEPPQVAAPAPSEPPAAPPATRYVVQRGDSVWKIYRTLSREGGDGEGWQKFLSTTRALNGLEDPDTIMPGKVLTITTEK